MYQRKNSSPFKEMREFETEEAAYETAREENARIVSSITTQSSFWAKIVPNEE